MDEILRAAQVDSPHVMIRNHHNGSFHGQKSNLEQLGPRGIHAQGATDDQPQDSTSSPYNIVLKHDEIIYNFVTYQEKNDEMARGFVGGITMGWKPEKLQVHVLKYHLLFIHSQIITDDGKVWHVSAMYVSPLEDRKKDMWTELTVTADSMTTSWIKGGGVQ
ncbi:hypothetical protein KIW84_031491 [Lathyrus oleraceus]|uniref:Uncharacterized protein n=1 Tax=Pisum sativum TaxID=3888 RepID=A0A9D5B0N9_PEA|nr:hypothetical protein KIW84_031491 [Pisum sativum]